jgi:glyoxylate/hydroxypyruvate reductase A
VTLVVHAPQETETWLRLFATELPDRPIRRWPDAGDLAAVHYFAGWRPQPGVLGAFPHLRAVFALGAGVDRFLSLPDLPPPSVPLVRLLDAGMARQMAEYALYGVLYFHRDMDRYAGQQQAALWQAHPAMDAERRRVSVLGLGVMGSAVARALSAHGFATTGWSRSPRTVDGVRTLHGRGALPGLLSQTNILVSVLPLTAETRGLLNAERLALLPEGAALINAGRGEHVDLDALLRLLDEGRLRGAMLDTLPEEPPPPEKPIWRHPKVVLTPHVAALTLPLPSVRQIGDNIRRLEAGQPLTGVVDRDRGY